MRAQRRREAHGSKGPRKPQSWVGAHILSTAFRCAWACAPGGRLFALDGGGCLAQDVGAEAEQVADRGRHHDALAVAGGPGHHALRQRLKALGVVQRLEPLLEVVRLGKKGRRVEAQHGGRARERDRRKALAEAVCELEQGPLLPGSAGGVHDGRQVCHEVDDARQVETQPPQRAQLEVLLRRLAVRLEAADKGVVQGRCHEAREEAAEILHERQASLRETPRHRPHLEL